MRALSPSPLMAKCTSYSQVLGMHLVFPRLVLLYILSCVSDAGSEVRPARGGARYAMRHSRAAVLPCSYPHTTHTSPLLLLKAMCRRVAPRQKKEIIPPRIKA